jgi:dihydropteroate synthase
LPYLEPKLDHRVLLLEGVKIYIANILKQTMLSFGGDVAVHRGVIAGSVDYSDCVLMGDLRHYRKLVEKLHAQPGMREVVEMICAQVFGRRTDLELKLGEGLAHWETRPVIMGILNVTPDSFSDGGTHLDPVAAVDHGLAMIEAGAQIIDIGGESTRPGAAEVPWEVEIARVIPVIERIAAQSSVPISIDTKKAAVARHALDKGARIINDVSALSDPRMMSLAAESGAGVVLMHMRGTPETMQADTSYAAILSEIYDFLEERINTCLASGIARQSIVIDPGIGFGKDISGNLSLIKHIGDFSSLGVAVMIGHSRKTFIGQTLETPVDDREEGTDAVSAWAMLEGVDIIRVHDVKRAFKVRTMLKAIQDAQ